MTLSLSIIFILSSTVVLLYLPASHEQQGSYRLSSLGNELTASEFENYRVTKILPNRFYYSNSQNAIVKKTPKVINGKNGKKLKAIPRWQYLMEKMNPFNLISNGKDTFDDNDNNEIPIDDEDMDEDDEADDGKNPGQKEENNDDQKDDDDKKNDDTKDEKNDQDTKNNKNDKNDKNDENFPFSSFPSLPSLPSMPSFSSLPSMQSLYDKMTEGNKKGDGVDYTGMAKDVLESEVTQDAIKTAVSLVPGGPGFLALYNTAMKMSEATGVKDKVPGLNKLKV